MRVRRWSTGVRVLLRPCALLLFWENPAWATSITPFAGETSPTVDGRLAVVVPCYDGDLRRALSSMERWPRNCSPVTLYSDLLLYKAEGDEESAKKILPILQQTAGQCFANTTIVYGHLAEEVSQFKLRGRP